MCIYLQYTFTKNFINNTTIHLLRVNIFSKLFRKRYLHYHYRINFQSN